MKFGVLAVSIIFSLSALAQSPSKSSSEILQDMKGLNTLGSVMYIAAHPDDENTRLLSYLANERKYRTVYLSLTRGDGGQNLIGSEQGKLLGMIRTEELLAARRIDGAEQWFTNAYDFGYSKTAEETFRFWDKDKVLSEVVFAIRKFRPDVIITRFPSTGEGGHGHHTASAILAIEAFDLAGNAEAFPEQLAFVSVWQPKRLFWNTFNFGSVNTTSKDQLQLDVGGFNPLLGRGYGEIAAMSRTCHKSQGFGSSLQRGSQIEYFQQLKGNIVAKDIFEGIETGWERLGDFAKTRKEIENCIGEFDVSHPEKSLKSLKKIYLNLRSLDEKDPDKKYWKIIKMNELKSILLASSGIYMESTVSDFRMVENHELEYTTSLIVRNNLDVRLKRIFNSLLSNIDTVCDVNLDFNKMFTYKKKAKLYDFNKFSEPYWLNTRGHGTQFTSLSDRFGRPANAEAPFTIVYLNIEGIEFALNIPVVYKYTDPVKGELKRPVEILPPITITPSRKVLILNGKASGHISYSVVSNVDDLKVKFILQGGANCKVNFTDTFFELKKRGDEKIIDVEISSSDTTNTSFLSGSVELEGKIWNIGIERIQYDHIPPRFMLNNDPILLINLNMPEDRKKIAYIKGAGDDVAECLSQIGCQVDVMDYEKLRTADLLKYDAIVFGIRAYNVNENLFSLHGKFMKYIEQGGRMIVQYNTNSRLGPIQNQIGPYPFKISRNRVTDENAEVQFIDDSIPLLNFPNKITKFDFENWIQERGIYFAEETDSNYIKVFKMHDGNEADLDGSLIFARYGKGYFVYTGLAFFRELPAGVPGAYRLFMNIISQPTYK